MSAPRHDGSGTAPPSGTVPRAATLGALDDGRRNGYDVLRLSLALLVIVWHSFPLAGTDIDASSPVMVGFLETTLNLFFGISGFLVLASWERRPEAVAHLRARFLRMMPGFWVCLVVVALVVAPLGALMTGRDVGELFGGPHSAWAYIAANATTHMAFFDVAGSPTGVPLTGAWNGTLWSLQWETLCYFVLVGLGLLGVTRRPAVLTLLAGAVGIGWVVLLAVPALADQWLLVNTLRFVFFFLLGACVRVHRHRLPVGAVPVSAAVALSVLGLAVPPLAPVTAPALVYLLHVTAATMTSPRFRPRWDVSFGVFLYGYPIQQLLVTAGVGVGNPLVLAPVAVALAVPVAVVSFLVVERPARTLPDRLRARRVRRVEQHTTDAPAADAPARAAGTAP